MADVTPTNLPWNEEALNHVAEHEITMIDKLLPWNFAALAAQPGAEKIGHGCES